MFLVSTIRACSGFRILFVFLSPRFCVSHTFHILSAPTLTPLLWPSISNLGLNSQSQSPPLPDTHTHTHTHTHTDTHTHTHTHTHVSNHAISCISPPVGRKEGQSPFGDIYPSSISNLLYVHRDHKGLLGTGNPGRPR